MTKRVRGQLFKVYVAANGEVTANHIRGAVRVLLAEIAVSERGLMVNRKQGANKMPRRNELNDMSVVMDLLNAFEVVQNASGEEQKELYELWRENSTQILALIVSPEGNEAWRSFSGQPIDCPPCEMLAPIYQELAQDYRECVVFAKLDSGENPHMSSKLNIRGTPTLILFKDGAVADTIIGLRPKRELQEWLDSVL